MKAEHFPVSHENTGEIVKLNIFRILGINQRLEIIQRVFIQEKWFNRSKNNELYNI